MKISMPCLSVIVVNRDMIIANNYNPNSVSKNRMELLKQSMLDNGFCYPIITIWDKDLQKYVIVDGFHRYTICLPEWLDIIEIPIIILTHDISKRMAATVQFNKARGVHQVDLDADIIRALLEQGMNEEDISIHLGIDLETIHRYKSLTGIAELFKNSQYSMSWGIVEDENE